MFCLPVCVFVGRNAARDRREGWRRGEKEREDCFKRETSEDMQTETCRVRTTAISALAAEFP